ncbi:MAG: hypothetical protein IVW57_00020 [Ktedonobacterales bacterium]|nr:hypothetical protein [Ktedonobacterales bacterium]
MDVLLSGLLWLVKAVLVLWGAAALLLAGWCVACVVAGIFHNCLRDTVELADGTVATRAQVTRWRAMKERYPATTDDVLAREP